jgi:hypothetical protein
MAPNCCLHFAKLLTLNTVESGVPNGEWIRFLLSLQYLSILPTICIITASENSRIYSTVLSYQPLYECDLWVCIWPQYNLWTVYHAALSIHVIMNNTSNCLHKAKLSIYQLVYLPLYGYEIWAVCKLSSLALCLIYTLDLNRSIIQYCILPCSSLYCSMNTTSKFSLSTSVWIPPLPVSVWIQPLRSLSIYCPTYIHVYICCQRDPPYNPTNPPNPPPSPLYNYREIFRYTQGRGMGGGE